MSPERWQSLKGEIKDKFKGWEEDGFDLDDSPGSVETITFDSPMGRMKLEFVVRPVVLGKKTQTSKRIGADVSVEYIYSDSEETHRLSAYKWDDVAQAWEEVKASAFAGE